MYHAALPFYPRIFYSFLPFRLFLGCPMIDLSACNAPASLSTQYNSESNAHIVSGWLMSFLLFAIPTAYGVFEYYADFLGVLSYVMMSFAIILGITFLVR